MMSVLFKCSSPSFDPKEAASMSKKTVGRALALTVLFHWNNYIFIGKAVSQATLTFYEGCLHVLDVCRVNETE